jgi:hypothetical protein
MKPVKIKKKKLALPRRSWKINPVTRVQKSGKSYFRPRVKRDRPRYEE